jgi:hypothetical protein
MCLVIIFYVYSLQKISTIIPYIIDGQRDCAQENHTASHFSYILHVSSYMPTVYLSHFDKRYWYPFS